MLLELLILRSTQPIFCNEHSNIAAFLLPLVQKMSQIGFTDSHSNHTHKVPQISIQSSKTRKPFLSYKPHVVIKRNSRYCALAEAHIEIDMQATFRFKL